MTVSSETNKDTYTGDGADTTFAFTFPILDETHLEVSLKESTTGVITIQVLTTDYTVSGTGNTTGLTDFTSGTVTFVAAPASTETIIIKRNVAVTQTTSYPENDRFPAKTHEKSVDKLTMISQELEEKLDRTAKVDAAVTSGFDATLPDPTANTDEFIKYAADGLSFESATLSTTGGLGNIVEDTSPQLGADLDANSFDIQFDDATGIRDDSDNEQLIFQKTASAVNHFEITNAASGSEPLISAVGDNDDVSFRVQSKGTGTIELEDATNVTGTLGVTGTSTLGVVNASGAVAAGVTVTVDGSASSAGSILLAEDTDNGTNTMGFIAPALVTATVTLELPDGDGTSGQFLTTNASAVLSWSSPAAGDWVFISSGAASSSATVEFSGIDSTFATYVFLMENMIPAIDGSDLHCRFDDGGGFDSGVSDYSWTVTGIGSAATSRTAQDAADAQIKLAVNCGSGTEEASHGMWFLHAPDSTNHSTIGGHAHYQDAGGEYLDMGLCGARGGGIVTTGVQFLMQSGDIASGTFYMYGIAKS